MGLHVVESDSSFRARLFEKSTTETLSIHVGRCIRVLKTRERVFNVNVLDVQSLECRSAFLQSYFLLSLTHLLRSVNLSLDIRKILISMRTSVQWDVLFFLPSYFVWQVLD